MRRPSSGDLSAALAGLALYAPAVLGLKIFFDRDVNNYWRPQIEWALKTLAAGQSIVGVTMNDVHAMNAAHAKEQHAVTPQEALALLRQNSAAAAAAIRALSDQELAQAAPVSLYADAPLTCQFVLEDHAVRHSYHHLARLRSTLAEQARG
ncbi:MAG: hypothetical protein ABL982_22970 [Vicinamibacterales bacterium]